MKKLKRGQPLIWLKTIKRELHSIDLTLNKANKTAQDRDNKYYQQIVIHEMDKAESITSQVEDYSSLVDEDNCDNTPRKWHRHSMRSD